jgi:hypothetical protein
MALRDCFRPPFSVRRDWHLFHKTWAANLSTGLNQRLLEGCFAEANVQFGTEIDVAAFAAFVPKCIGYLQQGVGLVIVDIVTNRTADLHGDLLSRLDSSAVTLSESQLYVAEYRPVIREEEPSLDIWHEVLEMGRPLPTMPLWLPGALCLPVELDATYERRCWEQRIFAEG